MFPLDSYEASLEAVEFLSRSANRVRVLDALTDDSWERRELAEETGVSRATLARILDDPTKEDRELLEAGTRRSPVWNLMRLGHEMEPSVAVSKAELAADD